MLFILISKVFVNKFLVKLLIKNNYFNKRLGNGNEFNTNNRVIKNLNKMKKLFFF